eukprot:132874-Pyramimonas_sp.AAC.1
MEARKAASSTSSSAETMSLLLLVSLLQRGEGAKVLRSGLGMERAERGVRDPSLDWPGDSIAED